MQIINAILSLMLIMTVVVFSIRTMANHICLTIRTQKGKTVALQVLPYRYKTINQKSCKKHTSRTQRFSKSIFIISKKFYFSSLI